MRLFHFQCLRRFFPKLADDTHGDLLAFLHGERMAGVTVDAGEGFIVNLQLQGLFGLPLCRSFGEVAQAAFSLVELVFAAAAEEDLAHDEV